MESTYVNIMIQSLNKKIKVLEEIKKLNQLQKDLLEDEKSSVDDFDKTVEDKSECIKQLEQLDDGFDSLFAKVKDALNSDKEAYVDRIRTMQELIRQITDLSMEIQAQESRNKDLMTRKFVSIKERAKVVRTNTKVASQYYKNMMNLHYVDPQFLDNKKQWSKII